MAAANPASAAAVGAAIRQAVARIARHHESGRSIAERPGVRMALLPRYRYRIFYQLREDTIRIVHIRHMSRRPWA